MKPTNARKTHGPGKPLALIGTALLAAGLTANLAAAATPDETPRQAVVKYSDLDLSRPDDARRLYGRIKSAAREVCDNSPAADLHKLRIYKQCIGKAVADAVSQVQSVQIAAIYRADNLHLSKE